MFSAQDAAKLVASKTKEEQMSDLLHSIFSQIKTMATSGLNATTVYIKFPEVRDKLLDLGYTVESYEDSDIFRIQWESNVQGQPHTPGSNTLH